MAQYEGAGFGGASTTSWWDEEERKRREKLGIAGAPLPPAGNAQAQAKATAKAPATAAKTFVSMAEAGGQYFRQAVARASESSAKVDSTSPLEEFVSLRKQYGAEGLNQRFREIKSVWDSYLQPLPSSSAIWELTKSGLALEEIETMAKEAHGSLQDILAEMPGDLQAKGWQRQQKAITSHTAWSGTINSALELYEQSIALDAQANQARLDVALPMIGETPEGVVREENPNGPITAGKLFSGVKDANVAVNLALVAMVMPIPGLGALPTWASTIFNVAKIGTVTTVGAQQAVAAEQKSYQKRIGAAATLAKDRADITVMDVVTADTPIALLENNPFAMRRDDPARNLVGLLKAITRGEIDMQPEELAEWCQSDIYDEQTGQMLYEGQFKEEPITGYLEPWMSQVVMDRASEARRMVIDWQASSLELGFGHDLGLNETHVNGNLSDERWKEVLERRDKAEQVMAGLEQYYPVAGAALMRMGIPASKADAQAQLNKLVEFGFGQAGLSLPIKVVEAFGSAADTFVANLDFAQRAANDPDYNQAFYDLWQYWQTTYDNTAQLPDDIRGLLAPAGAGAAGIMPGMESPEGKLSRLRLALSFGDSSQVEPLKADAKLMKLVGKLSDAEMRLIAGDSGHYDGDFISLITNTFPGFNAQSYEAWRHQHPDAVQAINMGVWIAQSVLTPFVKGAVKGRVPHSYVAARNDSRFIRAVDECLSFADTDDFHAVAKRSGSNEFAAAVQDYKRGTVEPTSRRIVATSEEMVGVIEQAGNRALRNTPRPAQTVAARPGDTIVPHAGQFKGRQLTYATKQGSRVQALTGEGVEVSLAASEVNLNARRAATVETFDADAVFKRAAVDALADYTGRPKTDPWLSTLVDAYRKQSKAQQVKIEKLAEPEAHLAYSQGGTAPTAMRVALETEPTYRVVVGKYAGKEGTIIKRTNARYVLDVGEAKPITVAKASVEGVVTESKVLQVTSGKFKGKQGMVLSETPKTVMLRIGGEDVRIAKSKTAEPSVQVKGALSTASPHMAPPPMPETVHGLTPAQLLARHVARRQHRIGDVYGPQDFKEYARFTAAQMYASGRPIFLELADPKFRRPGMWKEQIDRSIALVHNTYLRDLLGSLMSSIHRALPHAVTPDSPNFAEAIYSWCLAATGDVRVARNMANRAIRLRLPSQYRMFEKQLVELSSSRFRVPGKRTALSEGDSMIDYGSRAELGRRNYAEDDYSRSYFAPDPETGQALLTYRDNGRVMQAVAGPMGQKYTIRLGTDPQQLRYKRFTGMPNYEQIAGVLPDGNAVSRGLIITENFRRTMSNGIRNVSNLAGPINAQLRHIAVGTGFVVLGGKHTLADSGRTMAIEGVKPLALFKRYRRLANESLADASPQAARHMRWLAQGSKAGEQHWLVGGDAPVAGYTAQRGLRSPSRWQNIKRRFLPDQDTVAAVRRLTEDPPFYHWATGGHEAVRSYLDTAEGRTFLRQGDHYRGVKADAKVRGEKLTDSQVHSLAVDRYITDVVIRQYEGLEAVAPNFTGRVKILAARNAASDAKIKDVLRETIADFPEENPYLSIAVRREHRSNPFIQATGLAMTPNRMNREAVFNKVYVDTYRRLRKEGFDADTAVMAASETAFVRTQQVHFDLSRATQLEQKYRYMAWFATKHRLWAGFILRTAANNPSLAGAASQFVNWMRDRNSRMEGVGEYEKTNVILNLGGRFGRVSINLAPWLWLTDYPVESLMGQAVERIPRYAAAMLGKDIEDPWWESPMTFAPTITRLDPLFETMAMVINSPWGGSAVSPLGGDVGEVTKRLDTPEGQQEIVDWIDDLPEQTKWKIMRNAAQQRRWAEAEGESIGVTESIARAVTSMMAGQALKMLKPTSTRIVRAGEIRANVSDEEFAKLPPGEARYQYLKDNPWLRLVWGLEDDPYKKDIRDQKVAEYVANEEARTAELTDRWKLDRFSDWDAVQRINRTYDRKREELMQDSSEFKEWLEASDADKVADAFKFFDLGMEDFNAYNAEYGAPGQEEQKNTMDALNAAFQQEMVAYGSPDDSQPIYRIKKRLMVEEKYNRWRGFGPNDGMSSEERNIARYLARGGEEGERVSNQFREWADLQWSRDLMGGGVNMGSGDKSNPFLATMSTEEKERIGIHANPETEKMWEEWASRKWLYTKYQREHGISATSKLGKQQWAEFEQWSLDKVESDQSFAFEYTLSRMDFHERLQALGVGAGDSKDDTTWQKFFDIITDYHSELDGTYNKSKGDYGVTPRAQAAAPITEKYVVKVADFAKLNEEWWQRFRRLYSITKFGFYWKSDTPYDDMLYGPSYTPPIEHEYEFDDSLSGRIAEEEYERSL